MNANENNASVSVEESIKEALRDGQNVIESSRDGIGKAKNFTSAVNEIFDISPNSPTKQTLQPYIQKVQVITDKMDDKLKIIEYTLEYINNGDITRYH